MNLENNLTDQKSKREPGILKDRIWTADDCWSAEIEVIQSVEASEIFPSLNVTKSQTGMTGAKFVEKWRGIIKGFEVDDSGESIKNLKYKINPLT